MVDLRGKNKGLLIGAAVLVVVIVALVVVPRLGRKDVEPGGQPGSD